MRFHLTMWSNTKEMGSKRSNKIYNFYIVETVNSILKNKIYLRLFIDSNFRNQEVYIKYSWWDLNRLIVDEIYNHTVWIVHIILKSTQRDLTAKEGCIKTQVWFIKTFH